MEKRDKTEEMSSITPATATVAETSVEESQESSNTVGSDTVDTSKLGKLISKSNATSDVWKYFKVFEKNKNVAKCCVDNCNYVKEIKNGNTSHLRIHLQSQIHRGVYKEKRVNGGTRREVPGTSIFFGRFPVFAKKSGGCRYHVKKDENNTNVIKI